MKNNNTKNTHESKEQENQTQNKLKTKPHSKWRVVYFVLGIIFFLIIGSLTFLATGYGQRSALKIVDKFLDSLSIEQVSGSLQEGLVIKNTQFHSNGINLKNNLATVKVDPSCLFDYAICVENLSLENTQLDIDTQLLPKNEEPKKEKKDFHFPIKLIANNANINQFKLNIDNTLVTLDQINSGLEIEDKDINVQDTNIENVNVLLTKTLVKEQKDEQKTITQKSKTINWEEIKTTLQKPLLNSVETIQLPFNLNIPNIKAQNVAIHQSIEQENEASKQTNLITVHSALLEHLQLNESLIQLKSLDIQTNRGNLQIQSKLTLKDKLAINGHIIAQDLSYKELNIPKSNAKIQLSGHLLETTNIQLSSTGVLTGEGAGQVELAIPKMPFDFRLNQISAQYPLILTEHKKQPDVQVSHSNIHLFGDLLDYKIETSINAQGSNLPLTNIQAVGSGQLTQFNLDKLFLDGLDGTANMIGNLDWKDKIKWQSKTELFHINTKSLLPQWVAVLSGKFISMGEIDLTQSEKKWNIKLKEMDLNGRLFDKKLSLTGKIESNEKTLLNVDNTQLIYGNNAITMKGILDENSDFYLNIDAPNLKGLVPQLKANIKGNIHLTENIYKPNLNLDLIAKDIAYDKINLKSLTAKGRVSAKEIVEGDVKIDLVKFDFNTIKLNNAHLVLTGNEQDHRLQLKSLGEPIAANLQILGKFDRLSQTWQGYLKDTTIQSPVGAFANNKQIKINYDHQNFNVNIDEHCWKNKNTALCFTSAFNAGKEGNIPLEIKQLNLNILKPFLDKKTQLTGSIDGKGYIEWFKNKPPKVYFDVNTKPINLKQVIEYKSFNLGFDPANLKIDLQDDKLDINAKIKLKDNGQALTHLMVSDLSNKRLLSGNLDINNINIKLLKPLLAKNENIEGKINSRLTFKGSATAPLLNGQITLSELNAKTYSLPFDITGGSLNIAFFGTNSELKGKIISPDGELKLEGEANWKDINAWRTQIKAYGKDFFLNLPNMAKLKISPDIRVMATPEKLDVSGNVDIPFARIKVKELPPNITSVSRDEIIIDGTKQTGNLLNSLPKTQNGMAINANININLAEDNVHLNAYGLDTELYGTIKVSQGDKGLGLYGQVHLNKGIYKSFGQDLLIRKGEIIFSGIPSQPSLNIEAIRNPESLEDSNVIAGLSVTGMATSPIVKTFSEPQMSRAEVLSYILTGSGLENNNESGAQNAVLSAAIGLGLSQSSQLIGNIGDKLGLKDLALTTTGIGEKTQVVVSANLNPRFKVKYGKGIFAPLTELTLRYRLAPQLYLQWISNVNQTIDLMYKFKFD